MTGPVTPVLVASDLDRTLVFSPRATAELGGALPRSVVEVLDGRVISEMADVVRDRLAALARLPSDQLTLVPTTTRTVRQVQRIDLPFLPRFLVAGSGGVLLEDGQVDRQWAAATAERLRECAPAAEVRSVLDGLAVEGAVLRAYTADDQFCYAIVDPARFTREHVEDLAASLAPRSWRVAHQGRKVYVLPEALHKAHAISYVRDRLAGELGAAPTLLAAGDTWLDAEMLDLADRGWVPARSEIADAGPLPWLHVTVTRSPGHAGAAEIVAAWAGHARGAPVPAGGPRA